MIAENQVTVSAEKLANISKETLALIDNFYILEGNLEIIETFFNKIVSEEMLENKINTSIIYQNIDDFKIALAKYKKTLFYILYNLNTLNE